MDRITVNLGAILVMSVHSDHSIEGLIAGYWATMIEAVSPQSESLAKIYIGANQEGIVNDLTRLRAITDAYFLDLRNRAAGGQAQIGKELEGKLRQYPIKCCLEITRHMLLLLSAEDISDDSGGIAAIHGFCRNGGSVKRIWGALRGKYFQNAIQAGSYYIDVANDTVDPTKDKVELLPLEASGFRNIESFQEYAEVAETYWQCRMIRNQFFPALAPFFPIISFFKDASFRLDSKNDFMFPMNLESDFRLAEDYLFDERHGGWDSEFDRTILKDAIAGEDFSGGVLFRFYRDGGRGPVSEAFEFVRRSDEMALTEHINNILSFDPYIRKSSPGH